MAEKIELSYYKDQKNTVRVIKMKEKNIKEIDFII